MIAVARSGLTLRRQAGYAFSDLDSHPFGNLARVPDAARR